MYHYDITISILSKAPQNIEKSLYIGKKEIKKNNHKVELQDVIKAIKSQFKIASFPKVIKSFIEEEEFRQTVSLELKSFRQLQSDIKIKGIHESTFSIKVKETYVK